MIKVNKILKSYLIKLINPSENKLSMQYTELAIKILERGYITDYELHMLKNYGYKEM